MKPTSQPKILNYCIRRTGRDMARVALLIVAPIPNHSPGSEILRRPSGGEDADWRQNGLLLSQIYEDQIVAIIHVRRGDSIAIRWKSKDCMVPAISCFEVSATFEPIPTTFVSPDEFGIVRPHRNGIITADGACIHMHEPDLRKLLAARHPAWLQSRIDSTLDVWREDDPPFYFHIVPSGRIQSEIPTLARWDPARALAEFKISLGEELLQDCIARKPEAAVHHAFDRISRADRAGLVRCHATYVLNHYLDCLTELELEIAASADAMTAFNLRHFTEGRRHAIILARSYPAWFFVDRCRHDQGFADEVRESLMDYPRIWHRIHHHSFSILFQSLASTLGIVVSSEELLELLSRLGPRLGKELNRHIASLI